jgi:hypothetical protein
MSLTFLIPNKPSSQAFSVLNYAIFSNNGVISIRESGNPPKSLPSFGKHTINDVFSVKRCGNTITYLKNGMVFYTSTVITTKDMHFCVTFAYPGASVTDMLQYTSYPADGLFGIKNVKDISLNKATREVSYNHTVVATINQDRIPKFDLPHLLTENTSLIVCLPNEGRDFGGFPLSRIDITPLFENNKATREVSYNHTVVATINQDRIPKFDLGRGYTVITSLIVCLPNEGRDFGGFPLSRIDITPLFENGVVYF